MPSGLSDATAVEYNGYVFDMGGVNNGGSIDSIYAAPLLPGGGLGTWSMINSLPEAATSASSVINNGYVYEIGGFGNGGNGSTGNTYFASILGYLSPTLIPQTVDISSGSSTVVNVLSGASGDPDPNSLAIVSGPAHGIAVDPPGTITYTPNSGYSGSDSLTYKVCSLDDESLCSFGTLNFNVVSKSVVSAPDTGFGVYASATYRNIYVYASLSGIFIMFGLAIRRQKK